MSFETDRLILRPWVQSDLRFWQALAADADVMRYFPSTLDSQEARDLFERIIKHFETHNFGPWALELKTTGEWIGFTGINVCPFEAYFTPAVELGWRLAVKFQNQGYVTEAARFSCEYAFEKLKLQELVAFTVPANIPSRRVMEKLGMKHEPGDTFEHPLLPEHHPLREHVLYRLTPNDFK